MTLRNEVKKTPSLVYAFQVLANAGIHDRDARRLTKELLKSMAPNSVDIEDWLTKRAPRYGLKSPTKKVLSVLDEIEILSLFAFFLSTRNHDRAASYYAARVAFLYGAKADTNGGKRKGGKITANKKKNEKIFGDINNLVLAETLIEDGIPRKEISKIVAERKSISLKKAQRSLKAWRAAHR